MVVKVKFSCFAGLFPRHAGAFPTEKRETAQHEKALPKIANGTGPGVSLHDSDNMVQVIGFYAVIPERRTNAKRRGRLAGSRAVERTHTNPRRVKRRYRAAEYTTAPDHIAPNRPRHSLYFGARWDGRALPATSHLGKVT